MPVPSSLEADTPAEKRGDARGLIGAASGPGGVEMSFILYYVGLPEAEIGEPSFEESLSKLDSLVQSR